MLLAEESIHSSERPEGGIVANVSLKVKRLISSFGHMTVTLSPMGRNSDFLKREHSATSGQDGGIGRHGLSLHTTTSKLQ